MTSRYFNENDPYAAQWLRNLYPEATVDDRSIVDVQPDDLVGYQHCGFFGGIGGWQLALDLAGWPAEREIWSASLPCQPWSVAGKRAGVDDARHLWPEMLRLVRAGRPQCLIGEQVGSNLGREWIARVFDDLAACDYRTGAVDIPACSAGAPHIRQRLYWVATRRLADASGSRDRGEAGRDQTARAVAVGPAGGASGPSDDGGLADATGDRATGNGRHGACTPAETQGQDGGWRPRVERLHEPISDRTSDFWSDAILIPCADGRARRTQPSIFPLVAGLPPALDGAGPVSRGGALKGAGNAISPPLAAAFIRAFLDCE